MLRTPLGTKWQKYILDCFRKMLVEIVRNDVLISSQNSLDEFCSQLKSIPQIVILQINHPNTDNPKDTNWIRLRCDGRTCWHLCSMSNPWCFCVTDTLDHTINIIQVHTARPGQRCLRPSLSVWASVVCAGCSVHVCSSPRLLRSLSDTGEHCQEHLREFKFLIACSNSETFYWGSRTKRKETKKAGHRKEYMQRYKGKRPFTVSWIHSYIHLSQPTL